MKLVTFTIDGATRPGIWTDEGVVDLGSLCPGVRDVGGLIGIDLAEIRASAGRPPDHAHDAVRLEKPLLSWGRCFCVGVNYPERNEEYKDGSDRPQYPSLFVRFPESFVAHGRNLIRPKESEQLDYEGEVAIVIGKAGRRIAPERAHDHIFGYTIANEGSVRDWVRHGKFNVTPGKNFSRSGALGPWIMPSADIRHPLRIVTRVNDETRQDDTMDRMLFPVDRIITYISSFCTLQPGDLILTGTPAGAGARMTPPIYLKPGDRVEVEVDGIGTLCNTVADEDRDHA